MSDWAPKRFWTETTVTEAPEGFGVALDGRPVRTPAKAPLTVPTRALAEAIAAEWSAQEEKVVPATMPATRAANAAIDKVRLSAPAVAEMLAAYGGTDLICYRAEAPRELAERQRAGWDPVLDWAEAALGARLVPVEGIMPVEQDPRALARLADHVAAFEPFALTGVHDLVTISGSLILALAVTEGHLSPEEAWTLSRLDEQWNEAQWGADEEATAQAAQKRTAFLAAADFYARAQK